MVEVTAALLSRELTALRELLTATVATYAMSRQELCMPAHTSRLIAQFWEVVGWCGDFEGVLVRPDDPDAPGQMTALLDDWRAADLRGDGSYDRILEQLPARYRVVAIDDEHVTIADETEGLEGVLRHFALLARGGLSVLDKKIVFAQMFATAPCDAVADRWGPNGTHSTPGCRVRQELVPRRGQVRAEWDRFAAPAAREAARCSS